MFKTHRWLSVRLALLSAAFGGCMGGRVVDDNSGDAIASVTVYARPCPTCAEKTTTTNASGEFAFDPYEGGPNVMPSGEEATRFEFRKSGYGTLTMFRRPQWFEYEEDGQTRYGDAFLASMSWGFGDGLIDSDNDGLSNWYEDSIGTARTKSDTDGDGISDGSELLGSNWVDYAALGADPLHMDVFVEVDYEEYVTSGVTHSAKLSDAVITKLTTLYGNLNVLNPNGTRGIALHIIQDTKLPQGVACWDPYYKTTENFNIRHRDGFRYAVLCFTTSSGGQASGQRFHANTQEINATTSDDQTEARQFNWYSRFAHELAHTLGLHHGGASTEPNCKPNYPSLMNYAYDYSYEGSAGTLRDTRIRFSAGTFVNFPLNEAKLIETESFTGLSSGVSLNYLRFYGASSGADGFTVNGTQVDWNRNGVMDAASVAQTIRTRGASECKGATGLEVLHDFDDAALLASRLDLKIPGAETDGLDAGIEAEALATFREAVAMEPELRAGSKASPQVKQGATQRARRRAIRLQAKRDRMAALKVDPDEEFVCR